jgi:acyl-CoA synthetase (AMP-forming)/AMP-acid ligase II
MDVRYRSLADMIRRQSNKLGERLAFIGPTRTWTFSQLDAESNRIAQGFVAAGIAPGDAVACLSKHAPECVIWVLAASKVGAVAALLNWRLAAPELDYVIGVAQPKLLLFDDFLRETLRSVAMPSVTRRVTTDEIPGSESLRVWSAAYPPNDPCKESSVDSVVARLFSSGTTGRPKAIELSQLGLLAQCAGWTEIFGYREGETRHLNTLPTFHVSGLVNALWMLFIGGEAVFQPQFSPHEYFAAIAKYRVTDLFVVPAMLRSLIDAPEIGAADLSSLRSIAYGGSPIDKTLLEESMQRFRCGFLQVYGMTEVSGTITALCPIDHDPQGAKQPLLCSVGKPASHIALRVVDPITGAECGPGESGELWVRSVQNMIGYFRDPDATRAAFPQGRDEQGGWLRTGDGGYIENGYVFLRDRIKDMIISGGENVYPAEVENVLAQHPAILEAAVIGVPHQKWGETVKACLVFRPSAQATPGEIIAFARERLAHYKCPTSVDVLPTLPRNPSGKILKRVLREQYVFDQPRIRC